MWLFRKPVRHDYKPPAPLPPPPKKPVEFNKLRSRKTFYCDTHIPKYYLRTFVNNTKVRNTFEGMVNI